MSANRPKNTKKADLNIATYKGTRNMPLGISEVPER